MIKTNQTFLYVSYIWYIKKNPQNANMYSKFMQIFFTKVISVVKTMVSSFYNIYIYKDTIPLGPLVHLPGANQPQTTLPK